MDKDKKIHFFVIFNFLLWVSRIDDELTPLWRAQDLEHKLDSSPSQSLGLALKLAWGLQHMFDLSPNQSVGLASLLAGRPRGTGSPGTPWHPQAGMAEVVELSKHQQAISPYQSNHYQSQYPYVQPIQVYFWHRVRVFQLVFSGILTEQIGRGYCDNYVPQ